MIILSGDIGGTNTRLMLAEFKKNARLKSSFMNQLTILFTHTYHSANYKSLTDVIKLFLKDAKLKDKSIFAGSSFPIIELNDSKERTGSS